MDFLTLNDIIIHPLLSGPISLLFVTGIIGCAYTISKRFSKEEPSTPVFCTTFFIITGLIASTTFILVLLGQAILISLKILGGLICIVGCCFIYSHFSLLFSLGKKFLHVFRSQRLTFKIDIVLILLLVLILFFICFSPPTDSDSLCYHLGFPLEILRNGSLPIRNDWLHIHLCGLGEYINLLGLAVGTDNLGSLFQFIGMLIICLLFLTELKSKKDKLLSLMLFLSTPILLFFVPSQKPQLIGVAAIFTVLITFTPDKVCTKKKLFLTIGTLFFALSLKYSFYIFGSILWLYLGYRAIRHTLVRPFLLYSFIFYMIFLFPIHVTNTLAYSDPISPLGKALLFSTSHFHEHNFYVLLKSFKEGFGLPLGLLIPSSFGSISTTLGIGVLLILFIKKTNRSYRSFQYLFLLGMIFNWLFGQRTSRFYLEAYCLSIILFSVSPVIRAGINSFIHIVRIQLVITILLATLGVYTLFPGSFSFAKRDTVLTKSAYEYSAMRWLDSILPKNAFIISEFHTTAFLPRPFISENYETLLLQNRTELLDLLHTDNEERDYYLITKGEIDSTHILFNYYDRNNIKTRQLTRGTRNPFNNTSYTLYVYPIDILQFMGDHSDKT